MNSYLLIYIIHKPLQPCHHSSGLKTDLYIDVDLMRITMFGTVPRDKPKPIHISLFAKQWS
jgi:hypothetical protein